MIFGKVSKLCTVCYSSTFETEECKAFNVLEEFAIFPKPLTPLDVMSFYVPGESAKGVGGRLVDCDIAFSHPIVVN